MDSTEINRKFIGSQETGTNSYIQIKRTTWKKWIKS